jgi:hypothetical protein
VEQLCEDGQGVIKMGNFSNNATWSIPVIFYISILKFVLMYSCCPQILVLTFSIKFNELYKIRNFILPV